MTRPIPIPSLVALLVACLLGACASSAQRRAYGAEELEVYSRYAGPEIDQIRSFRLISWQPVSDYTLLLEARLNDWYLIEVDGPCMGLPFATRIGFKQTMNALQARFDSIIVERLPCRIRSIRPVDRRAAAAELRERRDTR